MPTVLTRAIPVVRILSLPNRQWEIRVNRASLPGSTSAVVGTVLIVAAIVIAVTSNHSNQWAVGIPIALAVVGVGLRVEAAILSSRSSEDRQPASR